MLEESEDLKGRWGTPHPSQRPSCPKWGAPVECRGRLLAYCGIWPWKQWLRLPRGCPGTPSVCLTGLSSSHPGRWGQRDSLFLLLFFLLLLKRGPFTSTWKTEGLLGMCQAKQKHMVWVYSPTTEHEKGGKWSSLP